ncbi:MAG: UbiD family decarboxylase, partial [Dehalococcoidia bacterium]|nr:UbiD family decarboxylase [Dehalococcoidia bacterium]
MAYKDLREWLARVEELGELRRAEGAHWDLELGAIAQMLEKGWRMTGKAVGKASSELEGRPAILFDRIKDYPQGYRVLVGMLGSLPRLALTSNLPLDIDQWGYVQQWKRRLEAPQLIPPTLVSSGPVVENYYTGKDIDLWKFPTPRWFELDGGRYIGTASAIITRDPDSGWVNLGTYRVQVHDTDTLGFYISPGKHGRIHRDKYFARGEPCPVVMCFGHDPLLHLVSSMQVPYGVSELDYAGGIRGEPLEVIKGEHTGLPIPAWAEIAIEGESPPGERRVEGPFGEWTGYYASGEREEPVVKVKALMHRHNPIMTGVPPRGSTLIRAAEIWNSLDKAGVPDVRGVWSYQGRFITVVSIKQRYPGHAKQAAVIASQCQSGAHIGRYVIVVDEDIDASNI